MTWRCSCIPVPSPNQMRAALSGRTSGSRKQVNAAIANSAPGRVTKNSAGISNRRQRAKQRTIYRHLAPATRRARTALREQTHGNQQLRERQESAPLGRFEFSVSRIINARELTRCAIAPLLSIRLHLINVVARLCSSILPPFFNRRGYVRVQTRSSFVSGIRRARAP